jgi:hypothetical protein
VAQALPRAITKAGKLSPDKPIPDILLPKTGV